MNFTEKLFELQDIGYADFQSKLTPGIDRDRFIGVRVPELRKFAKQIIKNEDCSPFLKNLPHDYYDENMLHALLVSEIKDYQLCETEIDAFLPYVNNWAVCDIMSPKIFKRHKTELIESIGKWASSQETYTVRFGLEMLMSHFLDDDFKPEYLNIPADIRSDEYYVKMMQAWFFATALAKQWEETVSYLINNKLDIWTHNKTIQKACESYRITDEQKAYLKSLKRS